MEGGIEIFYEDDQHLLKKILVGEENIDKYHYTDGKITNRPREVFNSKIIEVDKKLGTKTYFQEMTIKEISDILNIPNFKHQVINQLVYAFSPSSANTKMTLEEFASVDRTQAILLHSIYRLKGYSTFVKPISMDFRKEKNYDRYAFPTNIGWCCVHPGMTRLLFSDVYTKKLWAVIKCIDVTRNDLKSIGFKNLMTCTEVELNDYDLTVSDRDFYHVVGPNVFNNEFNYVPELDLHDDSYLIELENGVMRANGKELFRAKWQIS